MSLIYRNSLLASVVSVVGTGMVAGGILLILYKDILLGALFVVLGLPLVLLAHYISDKKELEKWWKQNVDEERQELLKTSLEEAIAIYNKKPGRMMVKKIQEFNPEAAEQIRQRIKEILAKRRGR